MKSKRIAIAGLLLGAGFVATVTGGPRPAGCFRGTGGGGRHTAPAGAALLPFSYPADPGPGAFYVTISGESNALTGYPFPPDNFSSDTYMPDGWEFQILEYIVVVDKIALWSNPDMSADPSQHGPQVAHL